MTPSPTVTPVLVVHGGAGQPSPDRGTDAPRLEGLRRACAAGWQILSRGGAALDAVEAAVRVLEDDPLFNAGRGAALTADGTVELDASIMDGATLRCGAVAAVRDVANPVSLARAVMERSPHVLLAGEGASSFAREVGIPPCDPAALVTPAQRVRFEAERDAARSRPGHGTVGAAARDARGHLAAATSTGGMMLKRAGRVGDTPIIGAGTYADDASAAVSCTGHGERVIQVTLARYAADRVAAGATPAEAAREAVRMLAARVQGEGGLILVGPAGDPGFAFCTEAMSRAWIGRDGVVHAAL
ncbi:Asparaginase [Anaeromyxobacter dehalogenans 2CP-1]|uniref:Isoaspartyl peptidase n=1 Tax=Anaeromyxobacter dehalogenans (strain ATCC BAA-258 / DSM 21875 / 2CP-1) TaxID=455488 RepID=B8J582_ANAD2|nr:isoaspartyl peptidase/L-asparaginase family protein [Anaeromyxobacter dehalogenans]ACL64937.1 Asparaginase [Anaeromyxobacter dehalogenans 2CP-1]